MKILGIDPGTAIVGYALVEVPERRGEPEIIRHGAVITDKRWPTARRLRVIYRELRKLITLIEPDCICIEQLFFSNNQKTAMAVAEARGVILLAAETAKKPIYSYTPAQVKLAVTESGRAKKREVQEKVALLYDLPAIPKPDDIADALAVVWTHVGLSRAGKERLA